MPTADMYSPSVAPVDIDGITGTPGKYALLSSSIGPMIAGSIGGIFATGAEKAYLLYGVLIGLAFGPVQASSRSYLARNITVAEAGRYFGIYALSGRATSFMATLSFSIATTISGSAHIGMATLIVFLGSGFLLLLRVPERTAG